MSCRCSIIWKSTQSIWLPQALVANLINKTFPEPMQDFNPLPPTYLQQNEDRTLPEFLVTEYQLFKSLSLLKPRKSTGPDGIPGWVLKENADILARLISGILNQSYCETRLPQSWKSANITPIPKEKTVRSINKHAPSPYFFDWITDFITCRKNEKKPGLLLGMGIGHSRCSPRHIVIGS